jgi:hypothetical protein
MENLKEIKKVLACFSKENRFYWIKKGILNKAQGTYLLIS